MRGEITSEHVKRLLGEAALRRSQAVAPEITARFFELPLREAREAFERIYFEQLLGARAEQHEPRRRKAGLERTHLYRKLKQLNIRFSRRADEGSMLTARRELSAATAPARCARSDRWRRWSSARSASSSATSAPARSTRCASASPGTHGLPLTPENVLGILSLIFWALMIVVTLKYVTLIMRADNRGEGGILALTALVSRGLERNARRRWWLVGFGIFGAAMFYGDGMITPAISVLAAVEGLEVVAPALQPLHRAGDAW